MVIMLFVLSLVLAWFLVSYLDIAEKLLELKTYTTFKSSLFFLVLSALPSFYFWHIRNKDKLQALQQSRESNEQHNFSSAMQLFVQKDNMPANAIGLQLLMKIKHQELFTAEIDIATCGKDLRGANLGEAQLRGANFAGANFAGANLQRADLQGANLQKADLRGANLQKADLRGANLQKADLQIANLGGANLQIANLAVADLGWAQLQGANLQKADLQRVRNWKEARWHDANVTDIECSDEETRAGIERLAKEEPRD